MRSPGRLILRLAVLLGGVAIAVTAYFGRSGSASGLWVPASRAAPDSGTVMRSGTIRPAAPLAGTVPIVPDSARTPGAVLPVTVADICTPGYARKVRDVPAAVKRAVYASYGITHHDPGEFEVDHLISLELGGSNSVRNLWPQSYRTSPWNARVKDVLENDLHRRVCNGSLDLATAQHDIAVDWIGAYKKYLHRSLPPPARRRPHAR